MIVFADTSALASAYLDNSADAYDVCQAIFAGRNPVAICEIADVEIARFFEQARIDGLLDAAGVAERLAAYDSHTSDNGPIGVAPLTGEVVARARQFVLQSGARVTDALHLAAAEHLAATSDNDVLILTRDPLQARTAQDLGFGLHHASIT